jgi:CRISPR system Cascade subunit CasB
MSQPQIEQDQQAFLLALFTEYDALSNGDKAGIRKTVEPDDLQMNPVFYRLIQDVLSQCKGAEQTKAREFFKNLSQAARLVYFLPFVRHQSNGKSLGALLKEQGISERRLFLVMRSEYPQDLMQLRRLCQQFKKDEKIDGLKLGKTLFYWGKDKSTSESSKRQLMKDFYLSFDKETEAATGADY